MAELPLDLTITEQITNSDSSITHLVENHPIFISQNIVNGVGEGQVWWANDGSLSITFSEEVEVEKSFKFFTFLSNKINLSVIIIIISTLLFVIIRRRNKITIDLDEEDEDDGLGDNYDKIVTKPEPISNDDVILEVEDEIIPDNLNQKDDSPSNRKTFYFDEEEEAVVTPTRRVRNSNQNKSLKIVMLMFCISSYRSFDRIEIMFVMCLLVVLMNSKYRLLMCLLVVLIACKVC